MSAGGDIIECMFEIAEGAVAVDADTVRAFTAALVSGEGPTDDAGRIDLIRAMEELKCAAEGRQAREAVAFDASQRAAAGRGGRAGRSGRGAGVAAQVALARRVSPHRGQRLLGLAKVLHAEMPHTMAAFRAGRISEWRATILARETAMLEREERAVVDAAARRRRRPAGGDGRPGARGCRGQPGRAARPRLGGAASPAGRGGAQRHDPARARHHDVRDRAAPGRPGRRRPRRADPGRRVQAGRG